MHIELKPNVPLTQIEKKILYKFIQDKKMDVSFSICKTNDTKILISLTEKIIEKNIKKTPTVHGSEVWFAYADAYKSKYKIQPTRNAKTNTICKRLVEYVGKEKAIELTKHYLTINDQWYLKNYHKMDFLLSDYQKIITSMESNIKINSTNARQFEQRQEKFDAIDRGFEFFEKMQLEANNEKS